MEAAQSAAITMASMMNVTVLIAVVWALLVLVGAAAARATLDGTTLLLKAMPP